jgi:hypothetical protein
LPLSKEWKSGAEWVTWSYAAKHLPAAFHESPAQFESFVKWLRSCPHRSPKLEPEGRTAIVLVCLGIGLVLRDLRTVQFDLGEGDSDEHLDESVKYLKHSRLGWGHTQALLRACRDIMDDIQICFPEEEDPLPLPKVTRKPKVPKPTPKRASTRQTAAAAKL